ncbi:hypothetical protein BH09MYX1_BH09MYX1_01060 [soil metagenome]
MWPTHSGAPSIPQSTLFAPAPSEIGHVVSVECDVAGLTSSGGFAWLFGGISGAVAFFLTMTGLHSANPATDDTHLFLSSFVAGALGAVAGYLIGQRFGVVPAQVKELTYIGLRGAARVRRDRSTELVCFADVSRVQITDKRIDATIFERTWTFVDHMGAQRCVTKGKSTLTSGSLDPADGTRDLAYHFGNAASVATEKHLAAGAAAVA